MQLIVLGYFGCFENFPKMIMTTNPVQQNIFSTEERIEIIGQANFCPWLGIYKLKDLSFFKPQILKGLLVNHAIK